MSSDALPPDISGRPATEDEMPRTARNFVSALTRGGFTTVAIYSRGVKLDGKKRVEAISVRATHPATLEEIRGLWYDGRIQATWRWWPGEFPRRTNLRTVMADLAVREVS